MALKKQKQIIFIIGMSTFGWLYFQAFSSLEINFIFKNYLAMLPLAILFTVYLILKKNRKLPNKN